MNLVERAKNIVMTPKTEWPVIAAEAAEPGQILVGYVIPLALIPTVATIIGTGLIGAGPIASLGFGVAMGVVALVTSVLGVLIGAVVVDILAPTFGSEKNFGRSLQLVAYGWTPAWLAGILNIIPALGILAAIAGLYGFYLLYLGLPVVKKTPQDKVVVYLIVVLVAILVVYMIIAAVLAAIVAVLGFGMLGAMGG
jgi:hypothetical protein